MIGQELRRCENWFLEAADKDAEWRAGYQEKHQDPNRLPFPDPWQFLLDAPAVPPNLKKVFRAAQSQLRNKPGRVHLDTNLNSYERHFLLI